MPSPKIHLPHCASCPYRLAFPACDLYCAGVLEDEIRRAGPRNVSCFIAETITGSCGGVIVPPDGYFERIGRICAKYEVVLIADEVMCGTGRTGKFLAASHFGGIPDILILGKGITAGYAPLAALLVSEKIYSAFERGSGAFLNNFTFAANPVSCAVASKVLEILDRDGLVGRAAFIGSYVRAALEKLTAKHIHLGRDVRGLGLILAADLYEDRETRTPFSPEKNMAEKLARACLDEGLVIYPGLLALAGKTGDCFLLGPPYTIKEAEVDELIELLDRALSRLFS
jgi:adenosylmethionine-8-amino-7-oxononanoate aminotransferase